MGCTFSKGQPVARVRLDPVLGGKRGHIGYAAAPRVPPCRDHHRGRHGPIFAGMEFRLPGAPKPAARASSWRSFASMNSEDAGCPPPRNSLDDRRQRVVEPPPRPARPSVVRSSRFSGTMQAACGLWRKRNRKHFAGGCHFEVQGQVGRLAGMRARSSSRIWRRSSRRWAVMPVPADFSPRFPQHAPDRG